MNCQHMRILDVGGKCSDCFSMSYIKKGNPAIEMQGYVPSDLNIGGGDYIEFRYCLDCGQILTGKFPVEESAVDVALSE